jgi:hypothetical protein
MSPRSSWALQRATALAAGVANLPAIGLRCAGRAHAGDLRSPRSRSLLPPERRRPGSSRGAISIVADGVRIDFLATPGAAEARQIAGAAQGAEQIGRALVCGTAPRPPGCSQPSRSAWIDDGARRATRGRAEAHSPTRPWAPVVPTLVSQAFHTGAPWASAPTVAAPLEVARGLFGGVGAAIALIAAAGGLLLDGSVQQAA